MTEGGTTIIKEKLIDVSSLDYVNEEGFFFHTTAGGIIKYCAKNDPDGVSPQAVDVNAMTKTFNASDVFNNPVMARKIFSATTTATGIYIGIAVK